nr:hypothetical protein [Tanacetum cinerariifolium]
MHKAFPLPEGTSHCLKKNATARRIEIPLPEDCTTINPMFKPNTSYAVELADGRVSETNIVGNKMHKAFPLPEGTSHCLKKNATARRIEIPLPEDCTTVIVKKKLSVKDDSFLKISAPCPALYSRSNCKL